MIVLPYVVSVFANGVDVPGDDSGSPFYVRVGIPDTEEADGVAEVEWTEYLAGILAKEMPQDSGEEAMKAQAVLIRTQIYRNLAGMEDKILMTDMSERWRRRTTLRSCTEIHTRGRRFIKAAPGRRGARRKRLAQRNILMWR